jgi:hypothetical protein
LKIVGIISTAILSLLLGFAGPAYAQHEHGEKQDHGKSQGDRHEDTLVPTMDSVSMACPFWLWADTLVSNIKDIGSVP